MNTSPPVEPHQAGATSSTSFPVSAGSLLAAAGEVESGITESLASIQAFDNGLLLWQPDTFQLLVLHASGRLTPFSSVDDLSLLGNPLAPARVLPIRVQRRRHATLLWSEETGVLLLYSHRWQLPLEGVSR